MCRKFDEVHKEHGQSLDHDTLKMIVVGFVGRGESSSP